MKIYSNVFDLTQPISRQVYVSPNSVYAFGIKIVKKGIPETDYQLKVFQNGTEIQPMGTIVDGFKLYQRTSPSNPTVTPYDVVYVKGDNIQHLDLVENTTNSTVFDIDQKGGALDMPIASSSVLGGIKVGKNLTIEADGTLNGKDTVEYTQGTGITIANGSISIDDTVALKDEIPTKTSELTNDSNLATVSQIPTAVGQLENDVGYIQDGQEVGDFNVSNLNVTGAMQINPNEVYNLEGAPINIVVSDQHIEDVAQNKINQIPSLHFNGQYDDGELFDFEVLVK